MSAPKYKILSAYTIQYNTMIIYVFMEIARSLILTIRM